MQKLTVCALAALAALPSLLLGCSVGTDAERVGATGTAATVAPALANLRVVPTDAMMTLSWTGAGAYSVTLTGIDGYASTITPTSNVVNAQSATFTGLTPCASYSWSVSLSGSVVESGVTNTRFSGATVCPTTQVIAPTSRWSFQGLEHQGGGSCSMYTSWPDGFGWERHTDAGGDGSVEFGFLHTSNSCESTVTSRRGQLMYALTDAQWARGVSNAVFSATTTSYGGNCAANGLPATSTSELREAVWGQLSDGGLWAPVLGSPETTDAIVHIAGATGGWPIAVSGGKATVNIGTPPFQTIAVGFAAPNDGYPDYAPIYGTTPSFADDGTKCMSTLTNTTLNVTFGAMPPETPICTASLVCGGATIACNASPETFQLVASDAKNPHRVVQTVDATSGTVAPVMNDPLGSAAESYSVCTVNAAGASRCVPVPVSQVTACPPVPTLVSCNDVLWSGATTNGTVTLNTVAPPGGAVVSLSAYDVYAATPPPVILPATVTVPAGSTTASFPIAIASSWTGHMSVGLLATASGTTLMAGATVVSGNIYAVADLDGYGQLPEGIPGTINVWVRNAAPPGGGLVTFAQTLPAVTNVPASLTIPAGTNVVSMILSSKGRGNDVATATYEGSSYALSLPMAGTPLAGGGGGCRGTTCQ